MSSWFSLLRRILFYAVMAWVLFFASVVVALRWWILPEINQYRPDIETGITRALGQKVAIAKIESGWLGLRPHLKLEQVVVHDAAGLPSLDFERIDATLSWYSLLLTELHFHRIELTRPRFDLTREPNGLIYVKGFTTAINDTSTPNHFSNWLLRQESIQLNHATLEWHDRLRGAPPLQLTDVGLRLKNSGKRHRFGFVASAPKELASTFDLRGDLHGRSFDHWQEWSGELYADLGKTDIAAWRPWLDLPYRVSQGQGAMRLWSELKQGRLVALSALVQLEKVRTRLGQKLPELDLAQLSGHLAWRELPRGFAFESQSMTLDAGDRRRFSTKNLRGRFEAADAKHLEQGEFRAENLEIAPLLALSEYLPLSEVQRKRLQEISPQGAFKRLALEWSGPTEAPRDYEVQGEFSNLGIQALGKLPGFTNVSGELQADAKGGSLKLSGHGTQLDMPLVFRQALLFDALEVAAQWRIKNRRLHLNIGKINFANAHLQGSVSGSYDLAPEGLGEADITGRLTHADAAAAHQYLPHAAGEKPHEWLKAALVQGKSDDVRIKLKGQLDRFPFAGDRDGVFQVTAQVRDGVLQYVPGWPRIEKIQAFLDFHGARMDIGNAQGTIFNTRIVRAKIAIADLARHDPVIEVDGETQGPTKDQLRFINESPLALSLDNITEQMHAEGNGRLALSLRLPIEHLQDTRVAGSYQFQANKIGLSLNAPPLEQASGKLEFSENGVVIPKITAQLLGGPITIGSRTTPDGVVRVGVNGRVSAEGLQKGFAGPFTQRLKGGANWSASLAVRKQAVNLVLVSNLVGLGSELPYPFNKAAADSMPLKFERRHLDATHDAWQLDLGKQLSAQLLRETAGEAPRITKGKISFGGSASTPILDGVWVDGRLEKLDADHWRSLLFASEDEPPGLALAGVQLQVKTFDFLGRRFNHFNLNAVSQEDTWQASVSSNEIEGDMNWRSHGGGRLVARIGKLVYPEAAPPRGVQPAGGHDLALPALDIVIDDMQLKQANLGKVELLANKQGKDWRIERLRISNPHATLNADGLWQSWLEQPQTKLALVLEVNDLGRFLTRMGYVDRIRGGTAQFSGNLGWRGSPQDFNLASLNGDMKLESRRGQFMKLDPGVGKLLGLLSLQALPRRLTLDFRDVFSEGFAFDSILGVMNVNQGVVSTNDFVMQGPSAVVSMSGTTDLVRETQNLRVKVVPVVGDSVSLLAFLGGPVAGIGTFVLSKLLKDPLGQIAAYDYAVSGTWENPVVAKVGSKPKETTP